MRIIHEGVNNPSRGMRSKREFVAALALATLLGTLTAAGVIFVETAALRVAVFAIPVLGAGVAGLWWERRGRERFPLQSLGEQPTDTT